MISSNNNLTQQNNKYTCIYFELRVHEFISSKEYTDFLVKNIRTF